MSAICDRYNIDPSTFISMVKDGVISTDVVLQFEYAQTFKMLCEAMGKAKARKETTASFCISRMTLWRALSKFG